MRNLHNGSFPASMLNKCLLGEIQVWLILLCTSGTPLSPYSPISDLYEFL